ncbi:hypothetical protein V1477_007861 [Vespula maculifrons]|uniref:Uncharacterized protein n=1 Tax=Vespula maculifrons TaxID=7453 RepID=A0ABD2CG12_VESMC
MISSKMINNLIEKYSKGREHRLISVSRRVRSRVDTCDVTYLSVSTEMINNQQSVFWRMKGSIMNLDKTYDMVRRGSIFYKQSAHKSNDIMETLTVKQLRFRGEAWSPTPEV